MANPIDISAEEYRTYTYADGSQLRIDWPIELRMEGGEEVATHVVTDKMGAVHRPRLGWVAIAWKPRDGGHIFVV